MRLSPQFFVVLLQLVSCFVHSCTSCNMSSHNRKACTSGAEWLYSIYKRSILNSYVVQLSDSILEHGIAIESCCCVFLYLVLFIYVSRNCLITIFLKLPPKCLSRNSITCAQETAHPPRHSSHTFFFFPILYLFPHPELNSSSPQGLLGHQWPSKYKCKTGEISINIILVSISSLLSEIVLKETSQEEKVKHLQYSISSSPLN